MCEKLGEIYVAFLYVYIFSGAFRNEKLGLSMIKNIIILQEKVEI
jgi:hypothetical protein